MAISSSLSLSFWPQLHKIQYTISVPTTVQANLRYCLYWSVPGARRNKSTNSSWSTWTERGPGSDNCLVFEIYFQYSNDNFLLMHGAGWCLRGGGWREQKRFLQNIIICSGSAARQKGDSNRAAFWRSDKLWLIVVAPSRPLNRFTWSTDYRN